MRFLEWSERFSKNTEFTYHGLDGARMTSPYTVEIEGESFVLDDLAWKDFGRFLGFSVKSLEKATDKLKMATFNDFLEQFDNADVVIQTRDGVAERFYRPDHPILPAGGVVLVLSSISNKDLGCVEDFLVSKVSSGPGMVRFDLVSDKEVRGWSDKNYSLRCGARVELSFDTKTSSKVETLLEFTPVYSGGEPFFISVPLPGKGERVSAKGLTRNEIYDSFQEAMETALSQAVEWKERGLEALGKAPMSQSGPKIDTMMEESKIPARVRSRIRERISEERPDFREEGRLSELEAILMLGEQSSSLEKSKAKVEHYLGSLLAMGGDQVIVCGCCGQRLPEDSMEDQEWPTT